MGAIKGYDEAPKSSPTRTAGKVFGYFFGILIMIIGIATFVASLYVYAIHAIFLLILSIAILGGGGLFLRWVHRK